MDWFKHDINAQTDTKIKKLIKVQGYEGYGLYWHVVEILYRNGGTLPIDELMDELDLIDHPEVSDTLESLGLIEIDEGTVTNRRIVEACNESEQRKKHFSNMGKASVERRLNQSITKVERTLDSGSTDKIRGDKIREEERLVIGQRPADPIPKGLESPPVITLITNTKEEVPILEKDVRMWKDTYPGVDVMAELRSMKAWLLANPTMRKTKNGMLRFVNNWLCKKQDRVVGRISQEEYIKGTNIKMPITADGSNPNKYKNSPTMEELYRRSRGEQ